MNDKRIDKFKEKISLTIVDTIKLMDENGRGILCIVDEDDTLQGTLIFSNSI